MFSLISAEFLRTWILFKRYPVNALGGILTLVIAFLALFLGARYIAGPQAQFGDRLEGLVVGFVLWTLVIFILSQFTYGLQEEARIGTLEHVFLSAYPMSRLMLMRSLAGVGFSCLYSLTILVTIVAVTGTRLTFQAEVFLAVLVMLMAVFGLGFLFGAVTLLTKRIEQLFGLIQFALLFLVVVPFETMPTPLYVIGMGLPMVPGVALLRDLMARALPFETELFLVALANGAAYLLLGYLVFAWAVRYVKRRGLVAGY